MNSWTPFKPGLLQDFTGGQFIALRSAFKPYKAQQQNGGLITFKKVTGKAEVYLNGTLLGTKTDAATADFEVKFAPLTGDSNNLNIIVESAPGTKAGLGGVVTVTAK